MKKVNVPISKTGKFAGKWVVFDPKIKRVIAVGKTLSEISKLVTHSIHEKIKPVGEAPYAFQIPRRGEGQYVLSI